MSHICTTGPQKGSFSDRKKLVSYVQKKNKAFVLLSTTHNNNKIDKNIGLLEMALNYSATKAAADRLDQLVTITVCRKGQITDRFSRSNSVHPQRKIKTSHYRRVFLETDT